MPVTAISIRKHAREISCSVVLSFIDKHNNCHLLLNPSLTLGDEFSFTKVQDVVTSTCDRRFHAAAAWTRKTRQHIPPNKWRRTRVSMPDNVQIGSSFWIGVVIDVRIGGHPIPKFCYAGLGDFGVYQVDRRQTR